jgi:cell wall-associated NlpC family hydrolase
MNSLPDLRVEPFRADLAARHLEGRVMAGRYADGEPYHVNASAVTVRERPDTASRQATQALHGEALTVYEVRDGWAWSQLAGDRYVGYIPLDGLTAGTAPVPTHRVTALRSFVFPEPDLKTPPLDVLTLGTATAVIGEDRGYRRLALGGWVYGKHLSVLDDVAPDIAATARRFLGVPYLWGGKTSLGLDCSGLVQVALAAAGRDVPRDSDQQGKAIGTPVAIGAPLRRGDVVFFPGHVGIMADDRHLIHANACHMMVTEEPLANVVARGASITGIRRLSLD